VQILYRKEKTDKVSAIVRTVVGTFRVDKDSRMDTRFDLHPDRYKWSKKKVGRPETRKKPTKRELDFHLYVFTHKMDLLQAHKKAFSVWRNAKAQKEAAYTLFWQPRIQKLNPKHEEIAEKIGFTGEFWMKNLMELGTDAKSEEVRLKATELGCTATEVSGQQQLQGNVMGLIMQGKKENKALAEEAEIVESD